jgi:hypothetical protein
MFNFQDMVLAQSAEHILLNQVLVLLTVLIYIPFTATLVGSMLLHGFGAKMLGLDSAPDYNFLGFIEDKGLPVFLLIALPPLAFLTLLLQVLQGIDSQIFTLNTLAVGLHLVAAVMLVISAKRTLFISLIMLFGGFVLMNASLVGLFLYKSMPDLVTILFNPANIIRVAGFLLFSLTMASAYHLFRIARMDIVTAIKGKLAGLTFKTAIVIPVLGVVSFLAMPFTALSEGVFIFAGLTFLSLLLVLANYAELEVGYEKILAKTGLVLLLMSVSLAIFADHKAMFNELYEHKVILLEKAGEHTDPKH